LSTIYFTLTNGTAAPGTIVVGSTPFQRSALTSSISVGLSRSARPRALIASASALPVSVIAFAISFQYSGIR
jgi:hypothetical protein